MDFLRELCVVTAIVAVVCGLTTGAAYELPVLPQRSLAAWVKGLVPREQLDGRTEKSPPESGSNGRLKDIWSDCGGPGDVGHIVHAAISPDPPVKGQPLNISVNGTLDQTVTSGSVKVLVVYNKFFPYSTVYDLCTLLTDIDKHCPLPKGNFTVAVNTMLDSGIPKGQYTGNAHAVDQSGNTMFCINLDFYMP